ncbi:DksA2 protein [Azoarcus olearius]|uniref:RNA polymerase-binding transcription factor DksA n=2 Tax=Azoarcus sp. (strain BH72) TaxID=418699 RepID=A1K7B4_AZOSB|nr:DksA2 protein [Azoarcus olearius]
MSNRQTAHFRRVLDSLKQSLIDDIQRAADELQDGPEALADPADRASAETELAVELRNRDREHKLIGKIDEALARIDAGEYGYCDNCGVEIGLKRLEARPTATLCIDCKTLAEIRERQVAS